MLKRKATSGAEIVPSARAKAWWDRISIHIRRIVIIYIYTCLGKGNYLEPLNSFFEVWGLEFGITIAWLGQWNVAGIKCKLRITCWCPAYPPPMKLFELCDGEIVRMAKKVVVRHNFICQFNRRDMGSGLDWLSSNLKHRPDLTENTRCTDQFIPSNPSRSNLTGWFPLKIKYLFPSASSTAHEGITASNRHLYPYISPNPPFMLNDAPSILKAPLNSNTIAIKPSRLDAKGGVAPYSRLIF